MPAHRAHDSKCLHGHKRREERSCRTAMQHSESWSASCRVLEPAERKCRHANLRAAVCSPLASGKHSGQRERRCFTSLRVAAVTPCTARPRPRAVRELPRRSFLCALQKSCDAPLITPQCTKNLATFPSLKRNTVTWLGCMQYGCNKRSRSNSTSRRSSSRAAAAEQEQCSNSNAATATTI